METNNKELLKEKSNRKYYSKSDGHFMPLDKALMAHRVIDRIAWVRNWVHKLGSRTHIDSGCKDGYLCLTLTAEGVECVGIDPSKDAIEEAKLKAKEAGLDVIFNVGFIEDIPVEKLWADTVSCLEVLEHVPNPDIIMKQLCALGPNIMISTPDMGGRHGMRDSIINKEHLRIYTKKELEEFVEKYGVIKESVVRDDQICILFRPKQK